MIEHSTDIEKLALALVQAQGAMTGAAKDSKNPHFKNAYASLESVIDASKPALQSAGIAFTQAPGQMINGAIEVTTMLMHQSGQWLRSTLHVPVSKLDAQGVGSAITYGCRYALMATLGLPPVDDDAEASVDRSTPRQQTTKTAPRLVEDRTILETMLLAMRMAKTKAQLDAWWIGQKGAARELSQPHRDELIEAIDAHAATMPNVLAGG